MGKPQLVTITEPPARSVERQKLAAAVERHTTAIEQLARVEAAIDHASETAYAVMETAAAAEAARLRELAWGLAS